jgi:hypothetical protein
LINWSLSEKAAGVSLRGEFPSAKAQERFCNEAISTVLFGACGPKKTGFSKICPDFVEGNATQCQIQVFSDRHYLVSVRKYQDLSLRGVFCRSLFFRLAITPDETAEIASSHKTLLAMTDR